MVQMTDNLTAELDRFQERVNEDPTVAQTAWKEGSGGGGGTGWLLLAALVLSVCVSWLDDSDGQEEQVVENRHDSSGSVT